MSRPNLSAAVLEYIREHPGCYARDVADHLASTFPDRKRKTLLSVPAQLKTQGRVRRAPGKRYFVVVAPPKPHVLKFEFDNPDVLRNFAVWLSNSGEQEYWQAMQMARLPDDTKVAVEFNYHGTSKTFLKDNTVRVTSGILKTLKDDYDDDGDD